MKGKSSYAPMILVLVLLFSASMLAQPGSLDQNYGTGGIASVSCSGTMQEAVMQSDGKIVMLFMNLSNGNRLVRFNGDGTVDGTFGVGGISNFTWVAAGGGSGQPVAMALQTNAGSQKIIVAGSTKMLVRNKASDALRVDRYLPDGTARY